MTCPGWLQYRFILAAGAVCSAWLSGAYPWWPPCMGGPGVQSCPACISMIDFDGDDDVDLKDFATYQTEIGQ